MNGIALPLLAADVCDGSLLGWLTGRFRRLNFCLPALHQLVFRLAEFADVFDDAGFAQAVKPVVRFATVAAQQRANLPRRGLAVRRDELDDMHLGWFE